MTTNTPAENLTLEELVAARCAIDVRIEEQLKCLRDSDLANAHKARREAIERYLPPEIEILLRTLRKCGIALVFHDGKLEGGPTGASLEENVRQATAGYAKFGFSEQFRNTLVRTVVDNTRDAPPAIFEHATLLQHDALQLLYRAAVRIRQLCQENPFTGTRAQILLLADGMHNIPLMLTGSTQERRENWDRFKSEVSALEDALAQAESSRASALPEREMPRFQLFSCLGRRANKSN